jgi:hypothetical protein
MLKEISTRNIAVIHSVCDNYPDTATSATTTTTNTTTVTFMTDPKYARLVQADIYHDPPPRRHPNVVVYTPYNDQATLHTKQSFWGLFLPNNNNSNRNMNDIWRSYITQRLIRTLDTKLHVVVSPPVVTRRSPQVSQPPDTSTTNNKSDTILYKLLMFLESWKAPPLSDNSSNNHSHFVRCIKDLWQQLYQQNFTSLEDLHAITFWLQALQLGGYSFPIRSTKTMTTATRMGSNDEVDISQGGIAARQECARRRLEQWTEPSPHIPNNKLLKINSTALNTNLGALRFLKKTRGEPGNSDSSSSKLAAISVARLLAAYELEHPFPHSIDLICRTGGRHAASELATLIESIDLYWPKCAGRILFVLDEGDAVFARENIPPWIEVMYSNFEYNMPGR